MKLFINYILCSVVFLTGIFACTAPIDIKTEASKPVLVVEGNVSDILEYQEVRLSKSAPFFDQEPNMLISGAKIQISTSDGDLFELSESAVEKGLYRSIRAFKGVPTVTYSLKIIVDFNNDGTIEEYTASTTMLEPPVIDSINILYLPVQSRTIFTSNLYAPNFGWDRFFLTRYLINDTLATSRLIQYRPIFSDMFGNADVNGTMIYTFRDNDARDDSGVSDMVFMSRGDTVTLLMSSIDRGYFNFISQCQKEYEGENPFFGGPPSNIVSNLSNGAVGYFSSTSTTRRTAIAPYESIQGLK